MPTWFERLGLKRERFIHFKPQNVQCFKHTYNPDKLNENVLRRFSLKRKISRFSTVKLCNELLGNFNASSGNVISVIKYHFTLEKELTFHLYNGTITKITCFEHHMLRKNILREIVAYARIKEGGGWRKWMMFVMNNPHDAGLEASQFE